MTLLGKVFTGLIFLFSVIFFTLAVAVNATHNNYRVLADKYKADVDSSTTKNQQLTEILQATKDELAIEQTARRSVLAAMQTQIETMQTELVTKEQTLSNLQSQLTQLTQTEQQTVQDLAAKTKENSDLRKQMVDALQDRNETHSRLAAVTDEYFRLQGNNQALVERYKDLANDSTKSKELLDILGMKPDTKLNIPPGVTGLVNAVASNGLVEINIGRDDGLRDGHTLDVSRNLQYIARIKITRVEANKAVGQILTGYQKGYVQKGDKVDSKLY